MNTKEIILKTVYEHFVESTDFNGIPLTELSNKLNIDYLKTIECVKEIVRDGKISIQTGTNPFIITLGHFTIDAQIDLLDSAKNNEITVLSHLPGLNVTCDSHLTCLYPTVEYLKNNRDVSCFNKKRYTQQLAIGEPQLKPVFFEIEVLDKYFRDPRYDFDFEDYSGEISYVTEDSLKEKDKIFLKTFGLGFDSDNNRVAVVFLRYLSSLTEEHQLHWYNYEIGTGCEMLQEYYYNTILGQFTYSVSIFSAFIEEQRVINSLCKIIYGRTIFKNTYEDGKKPKEFTFFFLPTLHNYNAFVMLLDKMISENIDTSFFTSLEYDLYRLIDLGEGVHERRTKGTLTLLKEWLADSKKWVSANQEYLDVLYKGFKYVREQRQRPAHAIDENIFQKQYSQMQMDIIKKAYNSMKILRCLLETHPGLGDNKIKTWLGKYKIKLF